MKNTIIKNNIFLQIRNILLNNVTIPSERTTSFFKTKKGEYGYHDRFIGVNVPTLRIIAKNFSDLPIDALKHLIASEFNEERFLALVILINQYQKARTEDKKFLYKFYLENIKYVNNWNLVDASAHHIIGDYLWQKSRDYLLTLAKSEIIWERRISIVATWYFIKKNELEWTFKIALLLLNDKHDLIHKAVGWMLREAGKKDQDKLIDFLEHYVMQMPRTTLRYAIEKFPEKRRKNYLLKTNNNAFSLF